jgi:DNA-binding transcriptional MerR regulator
MDGLMSSGAFAARTRLSRKALRLYDEMGLLRPAEVDSHTGYRSYAPEQVRRARLIGLLRRLELPLGQIAALLDLDPGTAAKALGETWRTAEDTHGERRRLVRYLQDLLTGKDDAVYDIQTRDVPEQKVLSTQRTVTVGDLPGFIDQAYSQLFAHLEAACVQVSGAPFVVFHGEVTEDSDGPVETCVPFTGAVEPSGTLGIRLEPAHTEAYTRIPKRQFQFPEILRAYDAVSEWLQHRGERLTLSPREVYFTDIAAAGDDDLVADIAFPYATSSSEHH